MPKYMRNMHTSPKRDGKPQRYHGKPQMCHRATLLHVRNCNGSELSGEDFWSDGDAAEALLDNDNNAAIDNADDHHNIIALQL